MMKSWERVGKTDDILKRKEVIPMRKGQIVIVVLMLWLGLAGYISAQQAPPGGGHKTGQGQHQMGPQGPMGPGMMGQTGGQGMMGMGPGMGMMGQMMGPMMGSPEVMGTMMSIHGEIQTLMGQMMQKYGRAMETMTPELQQQMQKEMMERMGDILTKQGAALKERAKAGGK